jgi:MFS family permease
VDTPGATGVRRSFLVLKRRAFRWFWVGALVSSSGTWMQNVTVPYLLYTSTGRASWAGLGAFSQFFPSMLLSTVGGVLADRIPLRRILITTQLVALGTALGLFLASRMGQATPVVLLGLVAVAGAANGIQTPSWQSLIPALVPRTELLNAVALNSLQANSARAFGPAVAGLVLARYGPEMAFLVNAASYLVLIAALVFVVRPPRPPGPVVPEPALGRVAAGIRYTGRHPGLALAVGLTALVSFVGTPVVQLAPVFAREVFHVGEVGLGLLASGLGVGAVLGSVLLSACGDAYGDDLSRSSVIRRAAIAHGLAAIGLGIAPSFPLAVASVVLLGVSYLAVLSTANVTMQLLVSESFRGRVLSQYWMAFAGAYPLGALIQGWLTDLIGVRLTMTAAGVVLLLTVAVLATRPGLLETVDRHTHREEPPAQDREQ